MFRERHTVGPTTLALATSRYLRKGKLMRAGFPAASKLPAYEWRRPLWYGDDRAIRKLITTMLCKGVRLRSRCNGTAARRSASREEFSLYRVRLIIRTSATLNGRGKFRHRLASLFPAPQCINLPTNVAQFVIRGSFRYIKFIYYNPLWSIAFHTPAVLFRSFDR